MSERRQKLAWVVLLTSLSICLGLVVVLPIGVNWVIQHTTRTMDVTVQANQGTVGIMQSDNESAAIFAGDPAYELNPGGSIITNAADTALILVETRPNGELVSRIQVYGNSVVELNEANTPRFNSSSEPSELGLQLNSGRMLLAVPEQESRPIIVTIESPHGIVTVNEAGQYSVSTTNTETQIAVLQGKALANENNSEIELESDTRAVLYTDGVIEGPLDAERNLIINGDFNRDLEEWVVLGSNIEIADQPNVEIKIEGDGDEPSVKFVRTGIGHADAGLRQIINQDVTDYTSLVLAMSMQVGEQSLGVCGEQGSECPLIVRIEYVDANGVNQTWQQGYYAVGEVGSTTPDVCVACPPPLNEHERIPYQQLVFFESENLIEKMSQLGIPPRQIKSITLIASGHTFNTEVVDVALMARE